MRNSKTCPKCKSTDIVRVPGGIGRFGEGNIIRVGVWSIFKNPPKVTRYLCASCGFSEEWVDSDADIARIREKFGVVI
jgi:hypothetical protein